MDDLSGGELVGGQPITYLRYAVDASLLVESEEEMKVLLHRSEII